MSLVATAAPVVEIPAVAGFAIGVLLLFGFVALLGIRQGYAHSLGALLRFLADELRGIRFIGGFLAGKLDALDHRIMQALAAGALACDKAAGKFFHASEWLVRWQIDHIVAFAHDTKAAVDALVDVVIPGQISERIKSKTDTVDAANQAKIATSGEALRRLANGIDRLRRDLATEQRARQQGIDALAAKLDAQLAKVRAEAHAGAVSLPRPVPVPKAHPYHVPSIATLLAVVPALAFGVLTRVAPWLRCSNVGRAGRGLCRMDSRLLDSLLDDALLIAGTISIVELARELGSATGFAADAVHGFIRED